MVLTRDVAGASADVSSTAQGWLPNDATSGLPDGDSNAGALDAPGSPEAASPEEPVEPENPYAEIPPDLLARHEQDVQAQVEQTWRGHLGELTRIKDNQLKAVNQRVLRSEAQLNAAMAFIKQRQQDWGLNDGDFAILENNSRKAADTAVQRYEATSQRYDAQLGWANDRLEANLTELFGPSGQRGYDHQRDPEFARLWSASQQAMGQWVMAGEPDDARFVRVQQAYDAVKQYLGAQKGRLSVPAQPQGQRGPQPPNSAERRAAQQQRGPAAPARTGGTGRGMTEDQAWQQASAEHPNDPKAQFRRALSLQEGTG